MRGVYPDPFESDGSEPPEPSGVAVLMWSGIAAVALLFAVAALALGLPPRSETPQSETAMFPSETGVVGRTDFSMRSDPAGRDTDIAQLRVENAALRKMVGSMQAELAGLNDRFAALERSLGSVTGSVRRTERLRPPPTPVPAPAPRSAPPAEQPAAAAEPIRRTAFGLELGVFTDLAAAEAAWRQLVADQPGLFADLEPVASVRDRNGSLELMLVAGPFASADDAAARCALAGAASLPCMPAFYLGQPLTLR